MRAIFVSTVLASITLTTRAARADQCAWVSARVAQDAQRLLQGRTALQFCEPCKDEEPGPPELASSVEVRKVGRYSEVVMNGHAIDLAYVYVEMSPHTFQNLGLLAACDASDVSTTLRLTSGGAITASGPLPEPTRAIPAPPPVVYIQPPATIPFALAVAGCTGLAAGATAWMALALTHRRRRALHPRAADLTISGPR